MSRIIFVNRYFYPDHSATSQILTDLAISLAAAGRNIHVITSRQVYDDPTALLPIEETAQGVTIHRVRTTCLGRTNLVKRAFDYVTFYFSAAQALAAIARSGDVVVAKTDPPMLSVLALPIAIWRSARLVNWLQDLYPETAVELGVPLLSKISRPIALLRNISLRRADRNVAISDAMARRLYSSGVAKEDVTVIHNWSDDTDIRPLDAATNPLRAEWGLSEKFVVGYSGNLGRAHEFETLLAAAKQLEAHTEIAFVVIGGGNQFKLLAERADRLGLSNSFRFMPYQPREQLRYSLTLPDAHWVSLRPEVEGLIFPSKFFGVAAAGRPILAVTASDGEMAALVREHGCGCVIEPGDPTALAEAILRLVREPRQTELMGQRARAMLDKKFTRELALARWRTVLAPLLDHTA